MRWRTLPRGAQLPSSTDLCLFVSTEEMYPVRLNNAVPGFSLTPTELITPDKTIDLPAAANRPESVVLHADAQTAVVASNMERRGRTRHWVGRVDLENAAIAQLSRGEGSASIRVGPDDALYVQLDLHPRRLLRVERASTELTPTIDGLGLH